MLCMRLRALSWGLLLAISQATAFSQDGSIDGNAVDNSTPSQSFESVMANAPPIIKIEEDWELVIATPDPQADCPQIVTVFGPTNPNFGTHTVFELNHGTLPSYSEGGMQLQVWTGNLLVGYRSQFSPTELRYTGETVRYTTRCEIRKSDYNYDGYWNRLRMEVVNGTSTTWGEFGGSTSLRISLWTSRDDLNPFDPNHSLTHSRVTFGANRVNRFCRKAIRLYTAEGLYASDNTTYYVHRLAADVN